MKLGILTFHSQLNYGGVLQCWALQTALEKLGHEVVVIDHWMDKDNSLLECGYNKFNLKCWLLFAIHALMGLGDINQLLRVRKTKRFLRRFLHLSAYHFVDWEYAPQDLGVNMLVVGSDQVWHCGDWGDPRVYLLENAPNVSAISYAASFGMVKMPDALSKTLPDIRPETVYRKGLKKFNAISCREKEGVELCRQLGFDAMHVADPTQLLDAKEWLDGLDLDINKCRYDQNKKVLVCYLINEDVCDFLPYFEAFAKKARCKIYILLNSAVWLPMPISIGKVKRYLKGLRFRLSPDIKILGNAGPREFVSLFAIANWVVSDSFHALMFGLTFNSNVRILSPKTKLRKTMFSRIAEYAQHIEGRLVMDNIREVLDSFANDEKISVDKIWLSQRISISKDYLAKAIGTY